MIKYLGSKRRLVPALAVLAEASGARTGLDLFCGTTRVSQAFKALGIEMTAVDSARCAHVLARCYVATDPDTSPGFLAEVAEAVDRLNTVPGVPGYVTETFCTDARGHVEVLAFDSARYVGARIGIHDPKGRKVGPVSHLRNTEYVVVCGPATRVRAMAAAVESAGLGLTVDRPVPVPAA